MQRFVDDEDGYRRWLGDHPDQYVLNTARTHLSLPRHTRHRDRDEGSGLMIDATTFREHLSLARHRDPAP
jgi:hypothetical protein